MNCAINTSIGLILLTLLAALIGFTLAPVELPPVADPDISLATSMPPATGFPSGTPTPAPFASWYNQTVIRGHDGNVNTLAWSPDGVRLVSGGDDGTVRIWDARSGAAINVLQGHEGPVWTVDWSPDGMRIVSGGNDGTIRLWDAFTGDLLDTAPAYDAWVGNVAWSPMGQLASVGNADTVDIWYLESANNLVRLWSLAGHESTVNAVAWFSDSRRLASGGGSGYPDNTVRQWNFPYERQDHIFWGHRGEVWAVAVSPDDTRIASGSSDRTVRVWSVYSGDPLFVFEGHTRAVTAVDWSSDGQFLASASGDSTIRLWDMATGESFAVLGDHTAWVGDVAWSPNGYRLASASADDTIRVWTP